MVSRRALVAAAGALAASGLAGCAGASVDEATTTTEPTDTTTQAMTDLTLTTAAFDDGGTIPDEYTCDGADVSPALAIDGAPENTAAFALVVDDPDAPGGTFTHWLLWNVPPGITEIPEGVATSATVESLGSARQGTNDFGETGYRGPCPPTGDGPHTYRFTLYALDAELDVEAGANVDAVTSAVENATVAEAHITGEYGR